MNREAFFQSIRKNIGPLTQRMVDGSNIILDVWEQNFKTRTPKTQFAVCLATTYHETGHTMWPIREMGNDAYLTKNYDVRGKNPDRARKMGNVRPGDGIRYCGRGDVQLTWYVNYLKATTRLRQLMLIAPDVDFTKDPDKVMDPKIAALIMFIGMNEGWFTCKTLDQFVDPVVDGNEHAQFVKARAIINGSDRAELIAGYADKFLMALTAAGT